MHRQTYLIHACTTTTSTSHLASCRFSTFQPVPIDYISENVDHTMQQRTSRAVIGRKRDSRRDLQFCIPSGESAPSCFPQPSPSLALPRTRTPSLARLLARSSSSVPRNRANRISLSLSAKKGGRQNLSADRRKNHRHIGVEKRRCSAQTRRRRRRRRGRQRAPWAPPRLRRPHPRPPRL